MKVTGRKSTRTRGCTRSSTVVAHRLTASTTKTSMVRSSSSVGACVSKFSQNSRFMRVIQSLASMGSMLEML